MTNRSGDQEGFGLSLAEAAMLELPIVSTLHDGIPEQVEEGQTGYLVREHDFETMAERLVLLLRSPRTVREMGKAAREKIQGLFSGRGRADHIAEIIKAVYEDESMGDIATDAEDDRLVRTP